MLKLFRSSISILPLLWTLGCQSALSSSSSVAAETPGESEQGTLLLGFKDPTVGWFISPSGGQVSVSPDGKLALDNLTGTGVIGAVVLAVNTAGQSLPMVITDATLPAASDYVWHYTLKQKDAQGNLVNACDKPEQLYRASTGEPYAIAIPGAWGAGDGMYYKNDSRRFTFGCSTGVVAKCVGWKYAPTVAFADKGTNRQTPGEDMLLACTRMARADYCANATPHTIDGTLIQIWDIYGAQQHRQLPGFSFEAAWKGQASLPDHPELAYPALCLSKLRWSTLPLGGECAGLPDPRVEPHARFCEEYSEAELENNGALIYNDSPFYDVGLYTWSEQSTKGWLSTSGFMPPSARNRGGPELRPGFTPPSSVRLAQSAPTFEGALFDRALTQLPDNVVMLSTYRCDYPPDDPTDNELLGYVTTTTPPTGNCTKVADEGYVYSPNRAYPDGTRNRVPLRRWSRWVQVGKDSKGQPRWEARSMTTTTAPATMSANGWWNNPVLEGYLPR
jgi:hypothetical protein